MDLQTFFRPRISRARRMHVVRELYGLLAQAERAGVPADRALEGYAAENTSAEYYKACAKAFGAGLALQALIGLALLAESNGNFLISENVERLTTLAALLASFLVAAPFLLLLLYGRSIGGAYARILALRLKRSFQSGLRMSLAMRRHKEWFLPHEIAAVEAGERAGDLPAALDRLARQSRATPLEDAARLFWWLAAVTLFSIVLLEGFLSVMIAPKLTDLLLQLGWDFDIQNAPWHLQIYFLLSRVFTLPNLLATLGLLAAAFGGWLLLGAWRTGLDGMLPLFLHVPGIGRVLRLRPLARFFETLAATSASGVPLPEALEVSGSASGLIATARMARRLKDAVERGESLSKALAREALPPRRCAALLRVAERNENLSEGCARLAEWLRETAEHRERRLAVALQPVVVLLYAVPVALTAVGVYAPLFMVTQLV